MATALIFQFHFVPSLSSREALPTDVSYRRLPEKSVLRDDLR